MSTTPEFTSNPPAQPQADPYERVFGLSQATTQGTNYRVRTLMENTHSELRIDEIRHTGAGWKCWLELKNCPTRYIGQIGWRSENDNHDSPTAAILSALASYDRKEGK